MPDRIAFHGLVQCRHGLVAILLAAVSLCGCGTSGPPKGMVHGKVSFDGQPVSEGTIRFENKHGVSLNANLGPDGNYQVQTYEGLGLPPGTYQVAVVPRVAAAAQPMLVGAARPAEEIPEFPHIPPKYRSISTSGLSINVQVGENPAFDFLPALPWLRIGPLRFDAPLEGRPRCSLDPLRGGDGISLLVSARGTVLRGT